MATRATQLGWRGEEAVRCWLEQRGFVFLERHFRTRSGEIDLVMRDRETLVFIEVKTRQTHRYGVPEESVTDRKVERMADAAEEYLRRHPAWKGPLRMDLVCIEWNGRNFRIRHVAGIS